MVYMPRATLRIGATAAAGMIAVCAVVVAIRFRSDESPRVAQDVAIAGRLARATPGDDQAVHAGQADELAAAPATAIIPCLSAFGSATPAGENWLRHALDRAAQRLGPELKVSALEAFARTATQPARARSLAFAWLKARDVGRADALLKNLLDDPALDLRRAAVEQLLASADGTDEANQKRVYQRALAAARDLDQIERIAGWLGEHGAPVDIAALLGIIRHWKVSGAFDNTGGAGFARVDPPESGGSPPDTTGWKEVTSADKLGLVDLNSAVTRKKEVLAYALAEVEMPRAQSADVRITSTCAVVVWVNGVKVMAHEIYHAGRSFDQYVASAEFRQGRNAVLVKCCQNEQAEWWAEDWHFSLRICDRSGKPVATTVTGGGDALPR